ncbi:hypothetical protein [Porphyromonas endodontalis]|uniref:FG-GAP repeat protein n=1 Tax=Porphyromonas endodontalis (strain ATCC 35406 / DSM 24491 / JCM 8526 / CCUG 16442 / BCRC 14492 / NCTC 13058 / HG 370) TaxID=553175 RepID=C3J8D8_POREA|nr:hypothetical protein [Porphyromonas endodontalis]EEN83593.1 hypothetical protein POREN0001_1383 [Porphyromonas endodontalis ATCC 35406]UBH63884.1 hypothetical protein LA319_04840 [Porphyromonas endodontalis]SUB67867.1 Uncharacterised protein [Porphyromonas endodontalis]
MKRKSVPLLLVMGLFFALNSNPIAAQKQKKSQLVKEGRTIEEVVPNGWDIQSATGDLNKDGIEDFVLIVRPNDPAHIKTRDDGFEYNFNPLFLAVYFGSPSGVYKRFKVWHDTVSGREDEYTDITNELSITPKGAIDISVSSWSSMGTAATGGSTYRYRFQSGDFYLIGEESSWLNRMTGEGESTSINYLTGQKEITTGNMIEEKDLKTKKVKIKKEPLRLLGSFQM